MPFKINPHTNHFDEALDYNLGDARYVNVTGDTMTGDLSLGSNDLSAGTLYATDSGASTFSGGIEVGDGTNELDVSNTGLVTMTGTAKGKLTLRPTLDQTSTLTGGIPTEVSRGLNIGYSMPIWSTPANQYEQLSFRMRIPFRWDGTTDPQIAVFVTLSANEDVGDKFKFQIEWQTEGPGDVMGTTVSTTVSEQTILTGRADAYDSYVIIFNLDADDVNNHIASGHMLQVRLRRIAASANEVSNEIIVWDWASMWCVNKMYPVWSAESNVS